jgi:hypothetical protein
MVLPTKPISYLIYLRSLTIRSKRKCSAPRAGFSIVARAATSPTLLLLPWWMPEEKSESGTQRRDQDAGGSWNQERAAAWVTRLAAQPSLTEAIRVSQWSAL